MRVLLVEDETVLADAIVTHLAGRGYAVDWVRSVEEASDYAAIAEHGIFLLDINLPDGSGLEFLKTMRAHGNEVPVLIISSREQLSDRIQALNAGADDYLIKPFDFDELVARLEAVRRRYSGSPNPIQRFADISLDTANRQAFKGDREVHLTRREWALLTRLMRRPGSILSKAQLEEALYDLDSVVESNTVEVYVSRLRRKLSREIIETRKGVGYRMRT